MLAWAWVSVIVLLPLGALLLGVGSELDSTLAALTTTEALSALSRTVTLAAIALVANVVLGVLTKNDKVMR